uniref:Uncharacterized protein n=1 Tax=Hemiselmis andersenii TaxID=464988 RepID=A0A6U4PIV2_HEMAN|mmetsp:Transcript_18828/g.43460  ORF Transcript_18828/g.43460 Transcript_18828/m.43460 type:complete len:162 (+) Transcript_18828:217-702(+)
MRQPKHMTLRVVCAVVMVAASVHSSPRAPTPTTASLDSGLGGLADRPEALIRSALEVKQMELQIEVNKRLSSQQAMLAQAHVVEEACRGEMEMDTFGGSGSGKFADLLQQPTELSSLMREMEGARREEMAAERALLREREYNAALAARIATLGNRFGDAAG